MANSKRNSMNPFEIHVEDSVLDDLIDRIRKTRWPGEIEDSGWDYGSNLQYVRELCEYWQNSFNIIFPAIYFISFINRRK